MVPTFSDWQISLTFPVFFPFSSVKISWFSSIWGKFPDFCSLIKIPRLFPDWKMVSHFPRFSSPCGTMKQRHLELVVAFVMLYVSLKYRWVKTTLGKPIFYFPPPNGQILCVTSGFKHPCSDVHDPIIYSNYWEYWWVARIDPCIKTISLKYLKDKVPLYFWRQILEGMVKFWKLIGWRRMGWWNREI